jgi:hypothetical protein
MLENSQSYHEFLGQRKAEMPTCIFVVHKIQIMSTINTQDSTPKKKVCFNLYLVRKSNHHRQVTKKSSLSIFVSGLDVVGNQKFVDVLAKIHHANIRIHPPPMPT